MSLYRQTKESLRNAGCHPRKRFGQNFLIDAGVLDAIVEAAELSSEDVVLEIGAGTGILTQRLALSSGKVIAVELDEGLFRILQSELQDRRNVTLIHGDILALDPLSLIDNSRNIKIVGNLPYYITKPILMKMLDLPVSMVLVMVQEEVGIRITASPGTKDYGALSIAIAYRSDVELLRRVPASSFYPKPKVGSVLIRLSIKPVPSVDLKDENLFFQIVRAAFNYRRKTLRNALRLASKSGETRLPGSSVFDSAFQKLDFDPGRRGETLSMEEFADLANIVSSLVYRNCGKSLRF